MSIEPSYQELERRLSESERILKESQARNKELMKQQKYWESLFHFIPNAIVTLDASHRVTEWNPGAEKDLRTSEKKYKTLIHTSPDAIALVDDTGRFVTVNSAMARRLDLDNQEPEGMRLHDLFSPESRSLQGWTRKGHLIVARELFRRLLRGWRISEKI